MGNKNNLKLLGQQTSKLFQKPELLGTGTVVGPKEGQGPLKDNFHEISKDELLDKPSWEQAESEMLYRACQYALSNAQVERRELDYFISGDLLNQTVSSNLVAKKLETPFLGLFGACSTMTEGLLVAAMIIESGLGHKVMAATSSHNKGLERQFRFPTEYGGQRPPYAQWTVSGAGAGILSRGDSSGPQINYITPGKVMDWGISDPYDLGSAMAPAAFDTLSAHLKDTGRDVSYYDMIITGDLGIQGTTMLKEMCSQVNLEIESVHHDCGIMIFDSDQDVHAGGSGCACSAVVMYGYIYNLLTTGQVNKVLLMATGALHNPQIIQQKIPIPSICHGISIENPNFGGDDSG